VDPDGHVAWWVTGALGGATWEVGKYLYKNRNKGYTWKVKLKAAGYGAAKGVLFGGIGRTFGYLSHFNVGKRVFQKGYKPVVRQLKSNYERFKKNPIKQIKRHPGARLDGMKRAKKQREKAFKNSTKAKLMRISNAVGRR
ncbi:type IV secretion protein Rhs, partial [Bacillus wiedmannii]